jgi:hypothetical protein
MVSAVSPGEKTMNEHEPFLKIRFDGDAVGPGKIHVPHLLRFLTNLNKAIQIKEKTNE